MAPLTAAVEFTLHPMLNAQFIDSRSHPPGYSLLNTARGFCLALRKADIWSFMDSESWCEQSSSSLNPPDSLTQERPNLNPPKRISQRVQRTVMRNVS